MAAGDECAGQAQACLIRVARLDDDGAPLVGDGNQYVSEGMISLEWTPDIATGDELESTNGCGDECVYYRAPDRSRKLDLTLSMCTPEPELLEMLSGGTLHTLTGVTVGYGLPATGTIGEGVNDVSIEVWERLFVGGSQIGHVRYVFPRTRGWRRTGSTHQNDVYDTTLEGFGVDAGDWGDGPGGDWSLLSDQDVTLYDSALETQTLPTAQCGAQPIAA